MPIFKVLHSTTFATVLAVTGFFTLPSPAQTFPEHEIRVISGHQAGGGADSIARYVANLVSEQLGQAVVVENRPGAGGGVAAAFVKSAQPDGYTILQSISGAVAVEPAFDDQIGYSKDDFVFLAAVGPFQEAFVARADAPWDNLNDMILSANEEGVRLGYGSQTRLDQLIIERVKEQSDSNIAIVPMAGGPEIISSILGGHIDFGFSGSLHNGLIETGELKALAVLGENRAKEHPEVSTMGELGFPLSLSMYAIFAVPKETPEEVVKVLSEAILNASKHEGFVELGGRYNFVPQMVGVEPAHAIINKQYSTISEALGN